MFPGWSQLQTSIVAALAIALLVVGTFAGCEHHSAAAARAERDGLELQRDSLVDTNGKNAKTITALFYTVGVWKALATPAEKMRAAAARAGEFEHQVRALSDKLDEQAEADDAKPDCTKLLDTDLEHVCPLVADGLRKRAARHPDGDQGSAGTGGREDRPRAHEGL